MTQETMAAPSRFRFSIITPVWNAAATIGDAITSVLDQQFPDFEHIIRDGGSTDGTLELLQQFPHLRVVSEPDDGLYDAMNRGAEQASGEFLVFLQGDDWLLPGALQSWDQVIQNNPSVDVVSGGAEAVREDGTLVWRKSGKGDGALDFQTLSLGEPMLNARLFRRDFFLQLGGFSPEFSLVADRDLLFQIALASCKSEVVEQTLYRYRWHEKSRTMTEGNTLSKSLNRENLTLCEKFLSRTQGLDRDALQKWHQQLSIQGAMVALEEGAGTELFGMAGRGIRQNAAWPVTLTGEVLRSFPGFVKRGFRTRSQAWKPSA